MTNGSSPHDRLKDVWQNQEPEGVRMSIEDLRNKAGKFRRRIWWRNAREYGAVIVLVFFLGFQLARPADLLTRAGFTLMIGGVLYVAWGLHKRSSTKRIPEELGLASSVNFFRQQLVRERDLLQSVGTWYLGPLLPGWVVVMIAIARTNPGHLPQFGFVCTAFNILSAAIFALVWKWNQRAARNVQRRIDELDTLQGTQ